MVLLLLIGLLSFGYGYAVKGWRESDFPLLSSVDHTSTFQQVFNPSWVEASPGTGGKSGLIIRSQNCTAKVGGPCVKCGGSGQLASVMTFSQDKGENRFTSIDKNSVVFGPATISETFGTEDPRIAYNKKDGLYYMFYTAYNGSSILLSLATSPNPTSPSSWTRHGPVFPHIQGSKSAALLFRDTPPHYLLWGDTDIRITKSNDPTSWPDPGQILLSPRKNMFDSQLVESGPPPFLLSTGDYIFFYNSATLPNATYHPAWVILDGQDPTIIKQRAEVPLLSPTLSWELGTAPYTCNVENVIFLEAAYKIAQDTFRVFYGGADAVIGSALVAVKR